MDFLGQAGTNFASPPVLAFMLGVVATGLRSDLRLPEPVYQAISIYLLFAIGLKGGGALSQANPADVWLPALAAIGVGVLIPVLAYAILRALGRFSIEDSAAIAAHYGSVSVVTFTAALLFLDSAGESYEGFLPALVAIMEVPGIVVALAIAQWRLAGDRGLGPVLHEVFAGKGILLLAGGLLVGTITGREGLDQTAPFFEAPFIGVLTLFLLEMGIVAASRARDLKAVGVPLVVFALAMPVINGAMGVTLGTLVGLSTGGATIFGVLTASASYIAAPAAVRVALPTANPGYYLAASLAVTFPFNLLVGIPLYYEFARAAAGLG